MTLQLMDHRTLLEIVQQAAGSSADRLKGLVDSDAQEKVARWYGEAVRLLQRAETDTAALSSARVHLDDAQAAELAVVEDAPAVHAIQALELYQRDRVTPPP